MRQLRAQPGFLKLRNTGFGHWHYTMTAWEADAMPSWKEARQLLFAHAKVLSF
jgi:hypothetical protein